MNMVSLPVWAGREIAMKASLESFFKMLKTELVYHEKYVAGQEANSSLFEYIEGFFNWKRIHSVLRYKSPEKFEKKSRVA